MLQLNVIPLMICWTVILSRLLYDDPEILYCMCGSQHSNDIGIS